MTPSPWNRPRHSRSRRSLRHPAFLAAAILIASIGTLRADDDSGTLRIPDSALEPISFADIDGWATDDHAAAFRTFLESCKPLTARLAALRDRRPVYVTLRPICRLAIDAGELDGAAARTFFETHFRPVKISKLGDAAGFLTGYYEPVVDGSRFPSPEFSTPLYRKPPDLVSAAPVQAGAAFPNKGLVGRRKGKAIEPYHDRAAIEDGVFDGQRLEIAWVRHPTDVLFIQIQGSGQIKLEDGTMPRLNYAAHNGYPYFPVGRALIERGHVPRDEMSMDRIRRWMKENPDGAQEVRRMNRSYVFFRITGLSADKEAVGAQGVPLTAGRSIAVDRAIHVYGTPFFVQAELPIESEKSQNKFRRLMVGQDTGSAIVGPARADIYFGPGAEAGSISGRLRHPGRFTMLVPKALDPAQLARGVPLPRPRPVIKDSNEAESDGPK